MGKLKVKCKKFKLKLKSRSFELFKKGEEIKDLRDSIEVKEEDVKLKDVTIQENGQKFNQIHDKLASLQRMKTRNKELEEEIKRKNNEIEETRSKTIKNKEDSVLMQKRWDIENEECREIKLQIKAKDGIIKAKETSIDVLGQQLIELHDIDVRNKQLEEETTKNDKQIGEMKTRMIKDAE